MISVQNIGSGLNLLQTSPTLITPNIGVASGTSLSLSATTASVSTTSGTLVVSGGVGIVGAVCIGGLLTANGGIIFGNSSNTVNLNPGVSIFSSGGFVYGIDLGYNATTLKFRNRIYCPTGADITFSSHNLSITNQASFTDHLIINGTTGNVGIGTLTPNAPLQFANTVGNRKLVLFDTNNDDHQYHGFGVNAGMNRYQVPPGNSHAFFVGVNSTTSNELMRISGTGNIGIGTTVPNGQLQLSNSVQNRKIVLWELANNDHECYGLGVNSFTFRYQVPTTTSAHVFYSATSSSNSIELFRISGTGTISRAVPNFGRWTAGASGVPSGVWTTIAGWGGSLGTGEVLTLYLNQAFVNNLGRAVGVSFTYSGKKNSNNFGLTSVRIMTSQTNGADATNWAQCDQGATDNVAITAQVYVASGYQLYVQAFQDSGSGNDFIDNRLSYIVS